MTKPRPSKRKARTWAEVPAKDAERVIGSMDSDASDAEHCSCPRGHRCRALACALRAAIAELRRAAKVKR